MAVEPRHAAEPTQAIVLQPAEHYRTIARPFDWTFTRNDLNQVLAKIADREPDLRLAA